MMIRSVTNINTPTYQEKSQPNTDHILQKMGRLNYLTKNPSKPCPKFKHQKPPRKKMVSVHKERSCTPACGLDGYCDFRITNNLGRPVIHDRHCSRCQDSVTNKSAKSLGPRRAIH